MLPQYFHNKYCSGCGGGGGCNGGVGCDYCLL